MQLESKFRERIAKVCKEQASLTPTLIRKVAAEFELKMENSEIEEGVGFLQDFDVHYQPDKVTRGQLSFLLTFFSIRKIHFNADDPELVHLRKIYLAMRKKQHVVCGAQVDFWRAFIREF